MRAIFLMMVLAGAARAQVHLMDEHPPPCGGNDVTFQRSTGEWACLVVVISSDGPPVPSGTSYVGTTLPAPAFQAQLDRIERMLRAICDHGYGGKPDCPKEPKP